MKPVEYQSAYVVLGEVKYHCTEPDGRGALPKAGILYPGRVVWLQHAPKLSEDTMRGFTEGIGVIEIDARLLHRA